VEGAQVLAILLGESQFQDTRSKQSWFAIPQRARFAPNPAQGYAVKLT